MLFQLNRSFVVNQIFVLIVVFSPHTIFAQGPQLSYQPAGFEKVKESKNIIYKIYDSDKKLHFDYYPALGTGSKDLPLVIIMNGFGDPSHKDNPASVQWAKAIAADGIPVVTFESHLNMVEPDFDDLFIYLCRNKSSYPFNGKCLVMQFSGNVTNGMPIITNKNRKEIIGAVTFYGFGAIKNYRQDLPVFFVRSGLDNPSLNQKIDSMLGKVLYQNMPWTIVMHHGGTHPFEFKEGDVASINIIKQTLAFFHRAAADEYQLALKKQENLIAAGTAVFQKNWKDAISGYEIEIQKDTSNFELYMRLGDAYYGDMAYQQALVAYDKSLQLGNWRRRDISIPASISAARLRDKVLTLQWLAVLIKAPGGKEFIKTSSEFGFLSNDQDFKSLIK